MKQVNLEEILNKHLANKIILEVDWDDMHLIKKAMQEACNQTVDLCAENAEIINKKVDYTGERAGGSYYVPIINKESILDTKIQIV